MVFIVIVIVSFRLGSLINKIIWFDVVIVRFRLLIILYILGVAGFEGRGKREGGIGYQVWY